MKEKLFSRNIKDLENVCKWQYLEFFQSSIVISLEYMIKNANSHPPKISFTKWKKILEEMLEGFKILEKKINHENITKYEEKKINRSFDLFNEYFFYLWD